MLWFVEFLSASLPKQFADSGFKFRELMPGLKNLRIITERCYAGSDIILISGLCHKGKLPGHDGHRGLLRNRVTVICYTATSGMMLIFIYILTQDITAYFHKHLFRSRKEILTYAASYIVPFIIRNLLLIIIPYLLFTLIDHSQSLLKCPSEQCSKV